jgi:glycosyltransferase involved in cell wall biosynthesis
VETGRYLYGGALQVLFLLEGLARRGIGNVLVCTRGSEIARQAQPYARVREIPMHGEADLFFPLRLSAAIRDTTPDLVHVHSRRGADIWGGLCARLHHIPGLITRRVDNREWPPIARLKYGSYDRIVTISRGIRQVLLEEGIVPERISCVRSAVDGERFKCERDREWFRAEFGVPASAPLIGVIAQLIPRKGHRFLLDITPALLSRFPELRIVFFGQGPLEAELGESIGRMGLGERVQLAGFREDMPRILPCLDMVVHPALMEGLGVSLLQAAACGVPLVAARAGGIPEVVRHGENGYLVEPGNSRELAEAITSLLADPELAARFGSQGRRIIQREFSIDTMVSGNVSIYEELLKGGRGCTRRG